MKFKTGLARPAQVALALLWIVLAASKCAKPDDFLRFLQAGLHLSSPLVEVLAWLTIGVEFFIGLGLLVSGPRVQHLALLASLFASGLAIIVTLLTPHQVCGCFGALLKADMARRLVLGGSMAYLAAFVIARRTSIEPNRGESQ